jgi:hypothetical protein
LENGIGGIGSIVNEHCDGNGSVANMSLKQIVF